MTTNRILLAACSALVVAAPVRAQSLFATRGLGVPAPAIDARAAALGGIGVGLIGFNTSLVNPAELAGLSRRGVSAALQPVTSTSSIDGEEDGTSGARFPMMRIIYPVSDRVVASVGYGSYLEQSWAITTQSEQQIGDRTITVSDLLRSNGGIAQLQLSAAYRLGATFALGASAGLLTGNVERTAARAYSDTAVSLRPFSDVRRWDYSAPIVTAGFRWDLAGLVRLSGSVMTGADLEATVSEGTGADETYGSPLELTFGASAQVSSLLTANAGVVRARTPATGAGTVSRDAWRIGGGLEYQGVRSGARTYPVRLGVRHAQLPYHHAGESEPSETAFGFGMGFVLGDRADPAAVADLALERASRSGLSSATVTGGLEERLWRFTFSLSLFGR